MAVQQRKRRVFVCFDIANDAKQFQFITAQSKLPDSPFQIVDFSVQWTPPEAEWREKLRKRLALIEVVILMAGPKAFRAHNVLEEVEIAVELGKPIIQTFGTQFADYKPVPKAGKIAKWNWEALKTYMNKP